MTRILWSMALVVLGAVPAAATTYTVTSTNDSGSGSLRECIQVANANAPGPHRIVFSFPGVGVQTIHLLTDLPALANPTAIDGTSQPGYNGVPLIELDGSLCSTGFNLAAAHSSVKGFVINRFLSTGVFVAAQACSLQACYVGTNAAGTAASPNASFGVYVSGSDALIGGRIPAYRNIISGNGFMGLALTAGAARDTVMNNYIGTDVTGTLAVPNADYGLETGGATQTVIDNNLVSGNDGFGIYVDSSSEPAPADGVRITRNYVGTDASGQHALPNTGKGIDLLSSYTIVGGINAGNVISGNGDFGIICDGAFLPSYHQILGNKIGVSADGTRPLGNAAGGIDLYNSTNNIIGVSRGDGSGNIIGANGGAGIQIDGTSVNNSIQGNAIGTSFNGALALGNTGAAITTESDLATIGGSGLAGNVIAHNNGGIYIDGVQNKIEGNLIFQNGPGLGIDNMQPALGVTPNDAPPDPDDGGNHLQNYPVLTGASVVGSSVQLVGTLASDFNRQYTIDFYSNRACSASGYGEGESWAGQLVATTDGTGNIGFLIMIPLSSVVGYVFTATATDDAGSTSEFSLCKSMSEPTAVDPAPTVSYALEASQPSPARGLTFLPFTLAHPSHVRLSAYDVSGRFVARLVDRDLPAGPGRAEWSLAGLAAGTYFCRLEAQANDGSGQHFQASTTVIVLP
ncbi:MAG TPA: right-handed parallel beta-helix repeat-containing protein [Candidatus Eisenbacteria bacterium]|nr:right-handed parallel beta-helix repeat-containing protein [Candidatus Eisenbacteria bacterium]